jgi:hypothetical protein
VRRRRARSLWPRIDTTICQELTAQGNAVRAIVGRVRDGPAVIRKSHVVATGAANLIRRAPFLSRPRTSVPSTACCEGNERDLACRCFLPTGRRMASEPRAMPNSAARSTPSTFAIPAGCPNCVWTDFLDTRAGVSGGCYELAASG